MNLTSPTSLFSSSSSPLLSSYCHIIFTALGLVLSGFIILFRCRNSRRLNLPPGPPGWPVVGNLFQFVFSGKPFFEYVKDLRKTYGSIFTLRMGATTMIVLSDSKLVHEALVERGNLFASRPAENQTRIVFSCNKFTVNSALYGPEWRSLRRNMVQNMLSSSRLKEFRHVRSSAMDTLARRIRAEADANGGLVWVLANTRFAFFSILLTMCFGLILEEEEVMRMDEMMKTVLMTLIPRIDDHLPLLSPFFYKQWKEAMKVRKQQVHLVLQLVTRRQRALQNPGSDKTATSFSYLDTLFDLRMEGRPSGPTNSELVTLCSEFLNGGTDTTANVLEWGMAQLIANPHVQDRLYQEIKSTVGEGAKVDENDVERMPYLHAVVKELLRMHPPTHFSLTHAVIEDTVLGGYDIPTGTNVELYLPGISMDPELWTDPERFDPERFMSGKEEADITGVRGVKMLPFGAGRRICPGLNMATVHVHLMLARMVQEFEWTAFPEGKKIDFAGKLQFTVVMKDTLRANVKPRV